MSRSGCRAVVLTCIDFRFVGPIRDWLVGQGYDGDYDLVAWPGGAHALVADDFEPVRDAIALACRLHEPEAVLLTVHEDCKAVGGSARFEDHVGEEGFQDEALAEAGRRLVSAVPSVRVRLLVATKDGRLRGGPETGLS